MSAAFSRSFQAIRADDQRRSALGLVVAVILLGAWLAWLFLARVARYEVSEAARVEVGQTAHVVATPVAGKVVAVHLDLGAAVEPGDVLVELDDGPLRLELGEKQARFDAVAAQIEPFRREIEVHEQALVEVGQAGRAELEEARARAHGADQAATFQDTAAARAARLRRGGALTEAEDERVAAEARTRRSEADVQQLAAARTDAEQRSRGSTLRAQLAGLRRQAAAIDGEKTALRAAIDALLGAIERRKVRAPIAGRIGELAVLRAGAFLKEGDPIGSIVPRGDLRVVAEFPLASVGRLREDQPARLRLEAFPWTEYGTVPAVVQSVGTEAQHGRVRVELRVLPEASPTLHLEHGLAGTAIVEVERVSPARLVLRAAGQLLRDPVRATP